MEEQSVHSSASDINSEEAAKSEPLIIPRKKRICLVGAAGEDPALGAAAQQFSVPVLKSDTGTEYVEDTSYCTYFILKQFEGPEYDALHKTAHRILGRTALLQLAEKKDSLPSISRPMYTQAMLGTVVVFTGFRKKDELTRLINMIHSMGGSIRKEMGAKVTHLIANCCGGEKYRYAVTFRVPIMSMNWVMALWDAKDDAASFGSNDDLIVSHKLKPFFGAKVCFFGFPDEEKKHMCEVLQQQGGEPAEIDDPNCTHVVTEPGGQYNRTTDIVDSIQQYSYPPRSHMTLRLSTSKPFAFTYYNPYTNQIPSIPETVSSVDDKASSYDAVNLKRRRCDRSSSLHNPYYASGHCLDIAKRRHSCFIPEATSYDSAICMDDTSSEPYSLPDESDMVFECSLGQFDSGVNISTSTRMSQVFGSQTDSAIGSFNSSRLSHRVSMVAASMEIDLDEKKMSDMSDSGKNMMPEIVTDSKAFHFSTPPQQIFNSEIETKSGKATRMRKVQSLSLKNHNDLKPQYTSTPPQSGTRDANITPPKNPRSLSPPRSAFSGKKAITPRRYIIWKKSKSCVTIPKLTPPSNSKFMKIYSHPNLSRKSDSPLNDVLLNSSPALSKKHKSFSNIQKLMTSILSKYDNINYSPSLKQYVHVSPCRKSTSLEKNWPRQKYTSLVSPVPVPAKVARLSYLEQGPRSYTPDKELPNPIQSSAPSTLRASKADQAKKQEDKPMLVVVDESNVNSVPDLASVRAHIVKAEWFWTSVQNEGAADEKEYLFEDYLESVQSPTASRRDSQQAATPTTASTRRKRKRLAETLSSLVQNGADSPAVHKRRSSISDAGHLSVSGSFLDCTASPDKQLLDDIPEVETVNTESARKNLSPRHQVFLELVQTESNYVGILSTIMTMFKSPLEDLIETSYELLNSTEAKIIFGNFPPIYEVHKKMLEELRYSAAHWTEDISIGNIFLKYASDLVKAYPSYVNFFENTKEMLDQCDQNKSRFHAFLKICQTKPECGRQSLKELLIKPVQRLPSISLLLNDILKHTNKNNPDHNALELSLGSIKQVMTYINEDKRKTEGQMAMFDIFNEIDNCPPHLVSSHRSFIGKCDVMELGEGLSGRGDHLVLFLFTDTLEICKKRSKAFNSLKSPNTANGLHSAKLSQGKPYKHIRMLSLSTIKKVVDIRETGDCHKVFALMVRSNQELKEKLFSFTITDEEVNKTNYLRTLCRQMANTVCKADADTFLINLNSDELQIDTSDVALGTLSKAFKFASRTRMKVGRAFSFNKTPSKLKRAMSTMMSPFGSTNSLTPASQQLAQMRLASCNNINELGNGGSGSPTRDEVLVAPMSVQPTRKAKCSSLSMASLRRPTMR